MSAAPLKTLLMANSIASSRYLQERVPVSSFCPALSAARDDTPELAFVCGSFFFFSLLKHGQKDQTSESLPKCEQNDGQNFGF